MATFLMIHGAWHTGACFDRLREPLERVGHAMVAPDLPAVGGEGRSLARASLRRWAEFAVEQARALPSPVILCAHSRGGIVASQAAEYAPEAFAAIIYISAALIPDGRSMYDVFGATMEKGAFGEALAATDDGLGVSISPEDAGRYFYSGCTAEEQAELIKQLVLEPVRPMGTKLSLTPSRYGMVPRHYVECAHDRTFPLELQRSMQSVLPCETVSRIESDHSPFISMPEQLADMLNGIARGLRTQ